MIKTRYQNKAFYLGFQELKSVRHMKKMLITLSPISPILKSELKKIEQVSLISLLLSFVCQPEE